MTLHDRIRAVVEERLRLAREATPGPWRALVRGISVDIWSDDLHWVTFEGTHHWRPSGQPDRNKWLVPDGRHIAANDPTDAILSAEHALSVLERHAIVHRSIHIFDDLDTYEELPVCGRCVPKHSTFRTLAEVPAACEPLLALATRWRVEVGG